MTNEKTICCVIGYPVKQSISPQLHNAGYKALGIDNEFDFVSPKEITPEGLGQFIRLLPGSSIRGVSVTIPHKIEIIKHLLAVGGTIDPVAKIIGAVNTVVNYDGKVTGYNTDWSGAAKAVEQVTQIKDKHVALLGAGGAARALAYAAMQRGAKKLVIYNRTLDRAQQLAHEFRGEARSLDDIAEIADADIILQGTDVGMNNVGGSLVPKEYIRPEQIVFDVVFKPVETQLLREAHAQRAMVVSGREMLMQLVLEQFKMYTGREPPEGAMRYAITSSRRE
jgi:shikimate dehydrogenase